MNKTILITGANSGLGKDAARQLALIEETEKIYLACRNKTKAEAAKIDLEKATGCSIFEIVIMDVSKPETVRKAVTKITKPVDALIMNAGGLGGENPFELTGDGVTSIFATNLLGHAVLVEEMLSANKLNKVALYAGSEAARGVKGSLQPPKLKTYSVEEFSSIINGSYFGQDKKPMIAYSLVKYMAALWMGALARKNPSLRFITMSPGSTGGTGIFDDFININNNVSAIKKLLFKYVIIPFVMPRKGMIHKLEIGAKRYLLGINDSSLTNGAFYASKSDKPTGAIANQNIFLSDFDNVGYQDNVYEAIHKLLK